MLKQSKQEPRKKREQLKLEADQMKVEINEIKKLLAEKVSDCFICETRAFLFLGF